MSGSIGLRLVLSLALVAEVAVCVSVLATKNAAYQETGALFDSRMEAAAEAILDVTRLEVIHGQSPVFSEMPVMEGYQRAFMFQVWKGQQLLLRSANAPSNPLGNQEEGFGEAVLSGQSLRVLVRRDAPHDLAIRIAEPEDARSHLSMVIAVQTLVPALLITTPLLLLLVWLAVTSSLRPLTLLRREVSSRSPEHLKPVRLEDVPREVLPLVKALNELFERVKHSVEGEKRFTADAALRSMNPPWPARNVARPTL